MPSGKKESENRLQLPLTVTTDYIKSNFFRVVHVDGVFGGMTPQGLVHLDFFSERRPIPKKTTYTVVDGQIGSEVREERVSRDAFSVREVEVGVVFDINFAKSLIVFLQSQIDEHEKAVEKT